MKKFILLGLLSFTLLTAFSSAFAAAGKLDPTFGNGGIVRTDFSNLDPRRRSLKQNLEASVVGTSTQLSGNPICLAGALFA